MNERISLGHLIWWTLNSTTGIRKHRKNSFICIRQEIRIFQELRLMKLFAPQNWIEFGCNRKFYFLPGIEKSSVHSKTNNSAIYSMTHTFWPLPLFDNNNKLKVCNWQCFVGWENMCVDCWFDIEYHVSVQYPLG